MHRAIALIALVVTSATLPALAQDSSKRDPPTPVDDRVSLAQLTLEVESGATVLATPEASALAADEICPALQATLDKNSAAIARLESVRRAALHLAKIGDGAIRRREAVRILHALDVACTARGDRASEATDPVAAAADLRLRSLARMDLGFSVDLFAQVGLVERAVDLVDYKTGIAYLEDAIGIWPMAELSFCAALVALADSRDKHLGDAIAGAPPGALLDKNLVSCFGQARIDRLRHAISPSLEVPPVPKDER